MELLEAAGLPPGVINFVPGAGAEVGDPALAHADLAGIHFTGSTGDFQACGATVGRNIGRYRSYPRIVGETGGKDFVFAHPSADVDALATALVRGAFEYQGQKCSAASRAYVPALALAARCATRCASRSPQIKVGDVARLPQLHGRGDRRPAFDSITGYSSRRAAVAGREVLARRRRRRQQGLVHRADGGAGHDDPRHRLMREEIFGPVLTVYVYDDAELDDDARPVRPRRRRTR